MAPSKLHSNQGSTVKGLTIERHKQMIGKEGPQTDDVNSVGQSAEIVEERTKNKDDCE